MRGALEAEGVDLRWVAEDPDAPTGMFYKWRSDGRTSVAYYRHGSAASRLTPADVPDAALDGVELVHLTGITMALGEGPRALVLDVARRARAAGAVVTFDPNYRPALWESPAAAAAAMEPVLSTWTGTCAAPARARRCSGVRGPEAVIEALPVPGAVVRIGERGAIVAAGGELSEVPPATTEQVVDEIGAGDAFAAGFVVRPAPGLGPRALHPRRERDRRRCAARHRRLGDPAAAGRRAVLKVGTAAG